MSATRPLPSQPLAISCRDGVILSGHLWSAPGQAGKLVIINPATGVPARYYHYYADFLSRHGFDVLTYDYRGIGLSRPAQLKRSGIRWHHWGTEDFDAVLCAASALLPGRTILVVGHSFGGFLPGYAPRAGIISRMLTIGAQYAWWPDYRAGHRARLFLKWHLAMPALTALCGYFPGKRLGWLEDLPAGVALDWSFRRARFETAHPKGERAAILDRFARVTAPILAVGLTDDDLATPAAIARGLIPYRGAKVTQVELSPEDVGDRATGHFGLFHSRQAPRFWRQSLAYLDKGTNPWPEKVTAMRDGALV